MSENLITHRLRAPGALAVVGLVLISGLVSLIGCDRDRRSLVLVTVSGLGVPSPGDPAETDLATLAAGRQRTMAIAPAANGPLAAMALLTGQAAGPATLSDALRLPAAHPTLAEQWKNAGAHTAAWIASGDLSPRHGFGRGFELLESIAYPADQPVLPDEVGRLRPPRGGLVRAAEVAGSFATWLRAHQDRRPLFAWIHLGDPAFAAAESPEADARRAWQVAVGEVREATTQIAAALETYGLTNCDLVIVGLHGEALGAGGELTHGLLPGPETYLVPVISSRPLVAPETRAVPLAALFGALSPRGGALASDGPAPVSAPDAARQLGWQVAAVDGQKGARAEAPPADRDLLAALRQARVQLVSGTPIDAVLNALAALAEAHPGAPAVGHAMLQTIVALPAPERQRLKPLEDRTVAALTTLAGRDTGRQIDLSRALLALGRPNDALERIRGLDVATDHGVALTAAELFAAGRSIDEARPLIETVLRTERDPADLHEWLGDLLLAAGSAYQARDAYAAAGAIPRGRTATLLAKWGDALQALGDHAGALQRYAEALQVDPGYRYPHARAASSLLAQGQEGAAADAVIKSVMPGDDPIRSAIAQARALIDLGLLGPAGNVLAAAQQQAPASDQLALQLSRVYGAAQNEERARAVLDEHVARVGHQSAALWVERARIAARSGNEAAAIDALGQAEPTASPGLSELVRRDPLFQKAGPASPLARAAAAFQGRGAAQEGPEPQ